MPRPMTCRETVRSMMDYVDHRLSTRDRRALEAHLGECPRCVEFLRAYRLTPAIVRRATESRLSAAARRRLARLVQSVARGPAARSRRPRPRR